MIGSQKFALTPNYFDNFQVNIQHQKTYGNTIYKNFIGGQYTTVSTSYVE